MQICFEIKKLRWEIIAQRLSPRTRPPQLDDSYASGPQNNSYNTGQYIQESI